MGRACITPQIPPEWTRALAGHSLQLPDGIRFGVGDPAADGSYFGQYNSSQESGIGRVSAAAGLLKIVRYPPKWGGLLGMAVDLPWVAWTQGESDTNAFDWTLQVWNAATDSVTAVATSHLPDGTFVFGQQPLPVLRGSMLSWAQPRPPSGTTNEAEVRVVELTTGRVTVLSSGRVSNPVFAGELLVWARRDEAGRYSFEAADAATLQRAALPAALAEPGSIMYLAGSRDLLAWSAEGLLQLAVWRIGSNQRREYTAPDIKHYFQFLGLADHFLFWYGGITSSILDLDTAAGFDVAGSVGGSDQFIAVERPTKPAAKGEFVASQLARVATADAPPVPRCSP